MSYQSTDFNIKHRGDWDCSKENIQPLKFGRSSQVVGGLKPNLHSGADGANSKTPNAATPNETDASLNDQRRYFEEKIRLQDGDDPLDYWFRYIKWIENAYPSGKFKEIKALAYKCILTLEEHTQYTNDFRWWYVWHKFASYSSNLGSLPIYEFMHSKGQCTGLAVFYKQWAFELEQAEDFAKAKKVYEMGLNAGAQPTRDLENALRDFEVRVGRKLGMQQTENNCEDTRKLLGVLKGVGKKATAPVIRRSTQEDPRLPKPLNAAPKECKFPIFDENKKQIEPNASSSRDFAQLTSLATDCSKENVRNPGIWPKQKLGTAVGSAAGKSHADFVIYADQTTDGNTTRSKSVNFASFEVLKPVKNDSPVETLMPKAGIVNKTKPTIKGEMKEVPAYDTNIVSGGLKELSFEEFRAIRWRNEHQFQEKYADTNCVPMEETSILFQVSPYKDDGACFLAQQQLDNSENRMVPFTTVPDPVRQQHPVLGPGLVPLSSKTQNLPPQKQHSQQKLVVFGEPVSISGGMDGGTGLGLVSNSSFTSKFYRDALAAFSNTLPLNDVRDEHVSSNTLEYQQRSVESAAFKIFDENAENRRTNLVLPSAVDLNAEDKENIAPMDNRNSSPSKRKAKGILTDALDIICDPSNDETKRESSTKTASASNQITEKAKFNESDFTVAGFMRPLIGERAVSTPCHQVSRSLLPSFSSTNPLGEVENENETCLIEHSQNRIDVSASKFLTNQDLHKTTDCYNVLSEVKRYENKLSTISEENSRECRSSSSSSCISSSASSGENFSTRKPVLNSFSRSTNLHTMAEQLASGSYKSSSQRFLFTSSASSSTNGYRRFLSENIDEINENSADEH